MICGRGFIVLLVFKVKILDCEGLVMYRLSYYWFYGYFYNVGLNKLSYLFILDVCSEFRVYFVY